MFGPPGPCFTNANVSPDTAQVFPAALMNKSPHKEPVVFDANENLQIEYERFKDLNLRLQTQYYAENSVGLIEKQSKEVLGMSKQKAKIIIIDEEKK